MGLRELKKHQTRERIAETARRLFAERGFDQVTVNEVAREAQVAPATVFNYFPTKEELFFGPLEFFGERLVEAVREREPGVPLLAAFQSHLAATSGLVAKLDSGDDTAADQLRTVNRIIAASPALRTRERDILAHATTALAAAIAEETEAAPDDPRPYTAANALMGVHRLLIDHIRTRAGEPGDLADLPESLNRVATEAFALLEQGLADYARKP